MWTEKTWLWIFWHLVTMWRDCESGASVPLRAESALDVLWPDLHFLMPIASLFQCQWHTNLIPDRFFPTMSSTFKAILRCFSISSIFWKRNRSHFLFMDGSNRNCISELIFGSRHASGNVILLYKASQNSTTNELGHRSIPTPSFEV